MSIGRLVNYLTNQSDVARALNNLSKVRTLRYKHFFTIPKVKVTWEQGRTTDPNSTLTYGRLGIKINGKPVRGSVQFDHAFMFRTVPRTQEFLDQWFSFKLSTLINSVSYKASYNRADAKSVVERMFHVKVKK